MNTTRLRLGDVLKERKRVTEVEISRLLEESQSQAPKGGPGGRMSLLGELLLQRGLVSKEELVVALEVVSQCRYVDARFANVDSTALNLLPRSSASKYCALPLMKQGRTLVAVLAEPQNLRVLDELRFVTGLQIEARLGLRPEILSAIEKCYDEGGKTSPQTPAVKDAPAAVLSSIALLEQADVADMQFFSVDANQRNQAAMEEFAAELRNERTPAVRMATAILSLAASKKASDVHIEPRSTSTVIRIRVDGVLRELTQIPNELQAALVSRIKILANMDIAERRMPQDGRFLMQIGGRRLDLRVSTLPTHDGEKVVMRLLDPAATRVSFTGLGFSEENSKTLTSLLASPQGMVLVTGPTGSGKSTTLYSALNMVRSPSVNVITVEDPVEYKVDDVNQVQINVKAGLTFATCLRSILRQDPNIIMVGEVRDPETAEIALQAAQTGHLVLSTLHTNDAVSAISRLLDLDVPNFMLCSSLSAVVAQRLARKLCFCRAEVPVTKEYAERMVAAGITDFDTKMYVPVGCAECDNTGYRGRVGIYEMLVFDETIRNAVRKGLRDHELSNLARSGGMRTMQQDAMEKVKQGLTTLEEVARVIHFEESTALHCRHCNQPVGAGFRFCPNCASIVTAPPMAAGVAAGASDAPREVHKARPVESKLPGANRPF